jgi:hypothetical protein
MVFCMAPALAQTNYSHDSSPAERAQTDALNADAVDRAHGDAVSDAASRDSFNVRQADYRNGMADHAARQQTYDRDMARYDRRWHRHGGSRNVISINFGDIAFGYSDGYWDNGHRWHAWNSDSDARAYRASHGSNFHSWRHDRNSDNGWQRH